MFRNSILMTFLFTYICFEKSYNIHRRIFNASSNCLNHQFGCIRTFIGLSDTCETLYTRINKTLFCSFKESCIIFFKELHIARLWFSPEYLKFLLLLTLKSLVKSYFDYIRRKYRFDTFIYIKAKMQYVITILIYINIPFSITTFVSET